MRLLLERKLNRKLRGSFTLEASLLLSFITFIIIAFLYMLFYLHDTAVLQSCSYMSSELQLAGKHSEKYRTLLGAKDTRPAPVPDDSLIMMNAKLNTDETGMLSIAGLFHMIRSYHSAKCTAYGEMSVAIGAAAGFTGHTLRADVTGFSIMPDYCDDWFKHNIREGEIER